MTADAGGFSLKIEKSIYDLDCVQRAAASLGNLASFNFNETAETLTVLISIRSPSTLTDKDVGDRLLAELLDQRLRQKVAAETKTERDLVLAYAFSNTKIVG
jgi:His-Xaa-Ser system protein HxsD